MTTARRTGARSVLLTLWLTPAESAAVDRAAHDAGAGARGRSAWIRRLLLAAAGYPTPEQTGAQNDGPAKKDRDGG